MDNLDYDMQKIDIAFEGDNGSYREKRMARVFPGNFAVWANGEGYVVTSMVSGTAVTRAFDTRRFADGCALALGRETTADVLEGINQRRNMKLPTRHEEYELMSVVNTIIDEWRVYEIEQAIEGIE